LRLAHARLALEEHRAPHPEREESAGREAPVGDIVVPVEELDYGVDGGWKRDGRCGGHRTKNRGTWPADKHSKQADRARRKGAPIADGLESFAMKGIFISYRRQDAAGYAGRLYDRLVSHFGAERVFMDVEGIEPGVDFVEALERAVASCEVLIVIIGNDWLSASAAGKRRLDDPA